MKKLVSVFLLMVLALSLWSTTALAAYEAPVQFSCVQTYHDRTYTATYWGTNGGIKFQSNEPLSTVPGLAEDAYRFCFYHDKLYFVFIDGSDSSPASLYSSDPDGSNVRLLADNVANDGNIYIVDNILYYVGYTSIPGWNEYQGYSGGLYSINLEDLSWKKICNDKNVFITYCDGDYIYYAISPYDSEKSSYYAIRTDGTGKMAVNPYCDEFGMLRSKEEYGFLKGNLLYYISGNQLYVRNKNGWGDRWLGSIPSGDMQIIDSVTDNEIICITSTYQELASYNPRVNVHRIPLY